ncbi:MAG: endoribonuclease MazF [Desulfuromonadales bacterium]
MVMTFVPGRGDIVWLDFSPQAGREQAGRRLALVLSPKKYNKVTGLMICCPLTTKIKGYPFEVATRIGGKSGVALVDHVKNVDWRARNAQKESSVNHETLLDVLAKIESLLSP